MKMQLICWRIDLRKQTVDCWKIKGKRSSTANDVRRMTLELLINLTCNWKYGLGLLVDF